jgi:hypothetical protein
MPSDVKAGTATPGGAGVVEDATCMDKRAIKMAILGETKSRRVVAVHVDNQQNNWVKKRIKAKFSFPESVRKEQSTTQDKNEKKLREIKTNSRPTQDRPRPIENNEDKECDEKNRQVGILVGCRSGSLIRQ